MNKFLLNIAVLALIAGGSATTYYYAYYLPNNGVKIQPQVTHTVAQTPEQIAAQKAANIKAMHDEDVKMKAWSDCNLNMLKAEDAYVQKVCGVNNGDILKWQTSQTCISGAQKSFTYEDCREKLF
ncbi:hypothetical protein BH11PAT2_BH11PAT2_05470 [soil metagenome]